MKNALKKIFFLLDHSQKKKTYWLIALLLLSAIMETAGIGLIMPLLALVGSPSLMQSQPIFSTLHVVLGQPEFRYFLTIIGGAFIALLILKNLYAVWLYITLTKFLLDCQISIERKLISTYLQQAYTFHLQKNPAELFQNVRNVSGIVSTVMHPTILAIAETFVLAGILIMLLTVNISVSLAGLIVFSLAAFAFYRFIRVRLREFGEQQLVQGFQLVKWLNQSFGGIKEIKIMGNAPFFIESCITHSRAYAHAGLMGQTMSQYIRPTIETLAYGGLILFLLYTVFTNRNYQETLPTIALFAGAGFRLLPGISRIVNSVSSLQQGMPLLNSVTNDLQSLKTLEVGAAASEKPSELFPFHSNIQLRNISYQYPNTKQDVIKDVSLEIIKGQSIAFVGHSGAGKTTMLDILLGLLPDYSGEILVDGNNIRSNLPLWHKKIGYIPQTIYLSDDTLRRNIAFGVPDALIDESKVWQAVEAAYLGNFIRGLPDGLDTIVGDRGARISGGQRQRIVIARALYNNPEILILDEATSALDNETEKEIINAIEQLANKKTIILIAHRLSTITKCDVIYFMENGKISARGNYSKLMETSENFKRLANA